MNRLNRRRFLALSSAAAGSAVLVACGNEAPTEEALSPTQIPDVPDAPPTLAPLTGTPGAADAGSSDAGSGDAGAGGGGGQMVIEALDVLAYEPNELDVYPGQTLTLHNTGFLPHDLKVDAWPTVDTASIANAETEDFTIPEDAAVGESFEFYCTEPGHKEGGMIGTFTIVEQGAETQAAGGEGDASATPAEEAATPAEEAAAASAGSGEPIVIEALDTLRFEPAELEVSPGQTLTLTNVGFLQHDLAVDDWGGALTELLMNSESQDFTIPEDAAVGEQFEFYCTVQGHREGGMVGTFTIVEGSGETAAAPAASDGEAAATPAEEATPSAMLGDEAAAAGVGSGEPVVIEALDTLRFEPAELEVSPGQTLTLTNVGFLQHDLAVDEWGGALTELLLNSESQDFTIPEDAAVGDQFEFYCTVQGHREGGMVGTFTIVEGSGEAVAAPAAGEGEATPEAAQAEATAEAAAAVEQGEFTGNEVHVTSREWEYDPAEIQVAPGDKIILTNEGSMAHDMASEEWGSPFIADVANGQTGAFVVPNDAEVGTEIVIFPTNGGARNLGMEATLTIVEATDGSAAAASPAASPQASPVASPATSSGGGATIEVHMLDTFRFEPSEFEVGVGDIIHLVNQGYLEHDFAIDDWSDQPLTPALLNGETHDVEVPDSAQSGETYDFYCSISGHREGGMVGKLTIR